MTIDFIITVKRERVDEISFDIHARCENISLTIQLNYLLLFDLVIL